VAVSGAVLFGALAQADVTTGDGDGDTPVSTALNPLQFGTVCVGVPYSKTILVAIRRFNDNDDTSDFNDGATVTLSFQATVENPAAPDVTESITDNSIVLPGNWESQSNGAMSDVLQGEPLGTAEITVNLTPSAPTVGQVETNLQYRTQGPDALGAGGLTLFRNGATKVQWTAQNCDSDGPGVTHSAGTPKYTDGGGNVYVTSDTPLNFDIDETNHGNSLPLDDCDVTITGPPAPVIPISGGFTCVEGDNNYTFDTAAPPNGANLNTLKDGPFTTEATAVDGVGNSRTKSFDFILDNSNPRLSACSGGPFVLNSGGGSQTVGLTADDGDPEGSGVDTANSTLSGTVDTTQVGSTTIKYTAVDNLGNEANRSCTYFVVYDFNGFFRPIDNLDTLNVVKAGQAIPVKFSLGGNQGLNIFAAGYPKSFVINCDTQADLDSIESTVTAGNSSLTYDSVANQYVYVWKTDKSWAGTCRQLDVKLTDGTTHSAWFKFTR
jgi:hypothetical protein